MLASTSLASAATDDATVTSNQTRPNGPCPKLRSYYTYFREQVFAPDLPIQLGLSDDSERSWVETVLALTIFSEARMEKSGGSLGAVAASILNRAGFGTPHFQTQRIADVATHGNDFSQWSLTYGLRNGCTPKWIASEVKPGDNYAERLAQARAANREVLEDPIKYSQLNERKHDYVRWLRRSVQLARCMVDDAERPESQQLSWVHDFGIYFIDPVKVAPAESCDQKGKGTACCDHAHYLGTPGRSYCPASAASPGWCDKDPPAGTPACGPAWQGVQHYELTAIHTKEQMEALDVRIRKYVAACDQRAMPQH